MNSVPAFLQLVLSCGGKSKAGADALFRKEDTDGDEKINYQELIRQTLMAILVTLWSDMSHSLTLNQKITWSTDHFRLNWAQRV